tara:strand:+ start:1839 stop:2561 length:723 start_codon:yes stop_codon:yes gene_type:complete
MKTCVIIPCRYDSVRFPGKPLKLLKGKPLLYYPYKTAKSVEGISEVYIATDNQQIKEVCEKLKIKFIMTKKTHLTGSDRVAEAFFKLKKFDSVINIQGDEPFISKNLIAKCLRKLKNNKTQVVEGISPIENISDVLNSGVVKVVINKTKIIAVSRFPIPYTQNKFSNFKYYRAVGIYGYKKRALQIFKQKKQKYLEKAESVEILRILENNMDVNYFIGNIRGPAVDTQNDLDKAEKILKK